MYVDILSGEVVNDVIPSIARFTSFLLFYFVFPATLASLSYITAFFL